MRQDHKLCMRKSADVKREVDMPKFMNNRYVETNLELQLFAEGGEDAGDDSGDGGDQDDDSEDDSDAGGDDEPKYTQADMDKAVARTIAKERRKAEKAAGKDKKKSGEESQGNKEESEDQKARREAEAKTSKLEVKVACFEAGVAKEAVEDVSALARAYMEADEELDLEEAIEKVVKKYPQFTKKNADDEEEPQAKSWGERQKGGRKKVSGVEAAFMKKNPGIKFD